MENRSQRLALITKIIQNEEVDSQDKLLQILNSKNCSVTQATLSRDLKLLKVFKRPTRDGRYLYSLSNTAPEQKPNIAKSSSSMDGFLSMEISGNLAVIKTVPAFAQPISQAIDDMDMPSIISTIAGNDTILVVIRNGFTGTNVAQDFAHYFPEIANKIK
ncbi:MAG: arginine repressor [Salinivirgaceae bacterium]|nr:arginine repressor [Salinivirgaceae bacterium]